MTVNTKYFSGGDSTILSAFTKIEQPEVQVTDVNELIMKCCTSKEALEKLYIMFKSSVFAIAFGITSDYHLSEDCVTETFVRLAQIKRFSPKGGDGKGFVFTVARNVALELRRRHKRETPDILIQSYGEAEKIVEDSIFLNQLLKQLNNKQRQIVVLKCYSELTFKEIAKIMKCPETTVKSRYKRAMTILKEKAGE